VANIQQRRTKDGAISYRVQVRLSGYPPQSATFDRKTDAKAWAQQTEAAIRAGQYFPHTEAKRHTLGALVDRRLEAVKRDRPRAYPKEKLILSWWKAELGAYGLSSLTPALIAEKRDQLLAENIGTKEAARYRSAATANRYLASLSKACTVAVREWHWLRENPVMRVQKGQEAPGRVRYLSDGERKRLLDACRASSLPELYLIVLIALTTGARRGEILGLRWPDVDLARRVAVLHVTKNRDRRVIPLVPEVVDLLKTHGHVRRLDTDRVFAQPGKDKKLEIDHWFQLALSAAKIKDFRFHDLRHTAASYLAMSGATPSEIAGVLGHRTLQMVRRYAHLSDQHVGGVVQRMTTKFFGQGGSAEAGKVPKGT
jgi:integrase